LAEQKDDGLLLFNLMGQCSQDVGPTKWTSVIAKQCPDNADCTKANFDECIKKYLETVAGFPNVGNQLLHWLCTAKKPALMPMHKFMQPGVQLLSYLKGGYLRRTIEVPTAQEKSEQIFFAQVKAHQFKFKDLNKTVPTDPLKLIAFFEQFQATVRRLVFQRRLPRTRSSQKRRKPLISLPCVAINQATSSIVATNIATTIEATIAIVTIADLIVFIETTVATIILDVITRTQRAASPMKRRMNASAITSAKRATRPCIMTSPLC
jgi:hypothetical protein